MLCVCRWSAQDDDCMAWISLPHSQKTRSTSFHPYTHCRTGLSPCQFLLNQGLHFRVPCLWRCAPQPHRMSKEKWQLSANLHISASERSISKMQTNHVVCDQIQHGVPVVEASGPRRHQRMSRLKLKPFGTHEKNNAVAVKRMGARQQLGVAKAD